jgi:arylsulfatase A
MASALPHGPFEVPGMEDRPLADIFAAMVRRFDETVGRVVATLEDLGIAERTLVLVTSDNGAVGLLKDNGLRGEKGSLYEGGIRVPLIAWWPGMVEAGVTEHIAAGWDLFATAADLAGAKPPSDNARSFAPLLRGEPQPEHAYLYWELHEVMTSQAVRFGHWKAARGAPNDAMELYDLKRDPNERQNVASGHPELIEQAAQLMDEAHEPHSDWPLRESTWQREALATWKAFGDWAYEADSAGIWYGELLVWARDLLR